MISFISNVLLVGLSFSSVDEPINVRGVDGGSIEVLSSEVERAYGEVLKKKIKSRNFDGIFTNDDGSTTISGPYFKVGGIPQSFSSDNANEVCGFFGFDQYLFQDFAKYDHPRGVVEVNDRGQLKSFSRRSNFEVITSIVCR